MTEFNKYFQDELEYLRSLGREFAQTYPALAPMLADKGGDPDVERLLEGVAFLSGRIRQKLDDELPELSSGIASLLFPQLIRPVPASCILQLTPTPNVLKTRRVVPRGSEFMSAPFSGTPCRFQSCWDCEVTPWSIERVSVEPLPGGKQQLRVAFKVERGVDFLHTLPERLRLHCAGGASSGLNLFAWVCNHTEQLVWSVPEGGSERQSILGPRSIQATGFEDDQCLLPLSSHSFPGFRLIQEYYALPSKFAFFDVLGVGDAARSVTPSDTFSLLFRMNAALPAAYLIEQDAIKLHCVPVVNVFSTSAEPIRFEQRRSRFLVRPAGLAPTHGEVYAVTRVEALSRRGREEVPSFLAFQHEDHSQKQLRYYFSTHMSPSVVGDGADVFLALGAAEDSGVIPDADVLSLELLATNGQLANSVKAGDLHLPTPSSPPYASFRNLTSVSPRVPPALGHDLAWRVSAHAAMTLSSLADLEVLRSVLNVHNLQALVDRQAARAGELRTLALKELRAQPCERLYRGAAVRGVTLELDIDEAGFAGDGDLFVFGSILDRLFGEYVSLNSFTQTVVHGTRSRLKYTWPPRNGSLTLL